MYSAIVVLFMFVLPLISVVIDVMVFGGAAGATAGTPALILLAGKWWVFWGIGVRLFTAGLRQAITPRFTAESIFHFKTDEPLVIVQELGFANIALGVAGMLAVLNSAWVLPAAVIGAVFYGSAGIRHIFKQDRNRLENIAMVSDLWMFVVLLAYIILTRVMPAKLIV